jgi:hypothetical protein
MEQVFASHSADSERAELNLVLAALAHTPRLAKILTYISERYFQDRIGEINEYNIATEVLGRSKNSFDASRDSIARVEAFRLRKRLKEYYETDGKGHEIQISLPAGSYVPAFTRSASLARMASEPDPQADDRQIENLSPAVVPGTEAALASSETGMVETSRPKARAIRKRRLLYAIGGIAALLVVSLVAIRLFS